MSFENSGDVLENGILKRCIEAGIESILDTLKSRSAHCEEQILTQKIIASECGQNESPFNKYAFLFGGGNECRHKQNMSLVYKTLIDSGFPENNIWILDGDGKPADENCRIAFSYPIHGPATKDNIENVFGELSQKICPDDLLIVYGTSHGGREETVECDGSGCRKVKVSTINICEGELPETEFARYLGIIKPQAGVLIFDQCHSGGFAERVGKGNYVAIAACKDEEKSYGNEFLKSFLTAWRDRNADLNKDGNISIYEAFKYALNNDIYVKEGLETPQIVSEINPDSVFLNSPVNGSRK